MAETLNSPFPSNHSVILEIPFRWSMYMVSRALLGMNPPAGAGYPPSAFYFKVGFELAEGKEDTSFQDVSGIGSEMETEEVVEGGENRYVHRLPKGVKHPNLVLKRGIAKIESPLITWCKAVLESDFGAHIVPSLITVFLLDENQTPIRAWSFANAYPVKWEIENFNSLKNEVAIETIEFSYTYSNRLI